MSYLPVEAEDLRIGLYIKLAGSWLSHPFSASKFKINNSKELDTLRGLKNFKFSYDPDLSDPEKPPKEAAHKQDSIEDLLDSQPASNSTKPAEDSPEPATPQNDGHQTFAQRRHEMEQAEKVYNEILGDNKAIILEVKAGSLQGGAKAEELVESLGDILEGGDGTLIALMNLMGVSEIGDEFYYHSLNVAMLSMAIATEFELPREHIIGVGMAGLFHDIGGTERETSSLYRASGLEVRKHKEVSQHPIRGREMLEGGDNFSKATLDAIAQHHERLDGTGYPLGLKGDAIHLYSKIIMVADTYDELSNNPRLEECLTPHQALASLYNRRNEKFFENAVVALVRNLGVYPPSSLVEMTDGSIGMVNTINKLDRMKPSVMLYTPDIPRDEALIVDLAHDSSIGIKQCIPPKDVSKEVWGFLNPRGMISYFSVPEETNSVAS